MTSLFLPIFDPPMSMSLLPNIFFAITKKGNFFGISKKDPFFMICKKFFKLNFVCDSFFCYYSISFFFSCLPLFCSQTPTSFLATLVGFFIIFWKFSKRLSYEFYHIFGHTVFFIIFLFIIFYKS